MGVDLFQRTRPDAELHPQFITLRDSPWHEPARGLLRELQVQFTDTDGNFVEQFQTNGFDARTFELYLFGFLKDGGHTVDRSNPSPDFMITKADMTAAVEAVTANPPPANEVQPYAAHDKEEPPLGIEKLYDDIAIRMGSPLFSKLQKRYWELPHVANRPLVIAIQDFHRAGSLMNSSTPLAQYLYGLTHHWYHDQDGKLIISAKAADAHRIGAKEIPSGFFNQPLAENVSAVLFTNAGTIPKFNRLGHEGRYRSGQVRMLRYGSCYRHDPNSDMPRAFLYEVGAHDKDPETWGEGAVLMHNPRALHPLPTGWFGAPLEERLEEGQIVSRFAEPFLPFMSMTMNFPGDTPTDVMQEVVDDLIAKLRELMPD